MARFKVALSGDFRKPDGSLTFPMFDLAPLQDDPAIEMVWVEPVDGVIPAAGLEGCHGLILLAPRFTTQSIPASGTLMAVARFGVGYDNVDVAACTAAGIALVITPSGVRRPVAVSVVTFMLALTQKLVIKDRLVRGGPEGWAARVDHMGTGLVGKTFGQLGIGNIGAEVFRMAAPFGLEFIAHDPYADPALATALGVELAGLEELFRRADILSVSVPLNEETHHIVNAERLALMKPTAYLINTARGPIVDQVALYDALKAGRLAGAGLDVFDVEPAPADEPLFTLDTVIAAPHALCWTDECFAGNGAADVAAMKALAAGRMPEGVVNRAVLTTDAFKARLAARA
ncbi:NAD(P)-dependent oxidoreductase [Acuticoccus yangtzensis]|uniref:NAD(P)-dependent oxidoreductase n=1 Tax=Acuticoccus yangtzensis TaxID=1443441 RepID=UPI0009495263|nr:NAD(P)-dependent oxidoreductase [Acuticoccus yangtzensis]